MTKLAWGKKITIRSKKSVYKLSCIELEKKKNYSWENIIHGNTLSCLINEKCESHYSEMNFQ